MAISSGEKWLTSKQILQESLAARISDMPADSCLRPAAGGGPCCPPNGASRGDWAYPGQEKPARRCLAQSIQVRSLGSRNGGRPKSWPKIRFGCVQLGNGSQFTSRRNMGRDSALFWGSSMSRINREDTEPARAPSTSLINNRSRLRLTAQRYKMCRLYFFPKRPFETTT